MAKVALQHRLEVIQNIIKENNIPSFRSNQFLQGIYKQFRKKYSEIVEVPNELRSKVINVLGDDILSLKPASTQKSSQADKVLFQLHDTHKIEAVYMQFKKPETLEEGHHSLCISSQVGCALACNFCATGAVGFKRQLSVDEITDQVLYFRQQGQPVSSVSFMGMGEPLMNPKIFDALKVLTDEKSLNMSERKINISTVGIIPGIEKLSAQFPKINIAFSLHSPFEEQRDILVPANKNYPLPEVMKVLSTHVKHSKRKLFMAYLVLDGYNDTEEHAKGIARLFNNLDNDIRYLFHLNLLRYNPAEGIDEKYQRTNEDNLLKFKDSLMRKNIPTTVRASFGVDIDAACGQLYARYEQKVKGKKQPTRSSANPSKQAIIT